jgi:hypothetical protein
MAYNNNGNGYKTSKQNENVKGRILYKKFYKTVKCGKYINHAMGGPMVIERDVQHRKYKDSSLR